MHLKIRSAGKNFPPKEPPCKKAEARTYVRTDRFDLTGDETTDTAIKNMWRSQGSQHRAENNVLYRDATETSWFFLWMGTGPIRELVDKFGPIVIRRQVADPDKWEIIANVADLPDDELRDVVTDKTLGLVEHDKWH